MRLIDTLTDFIENFDIITGAAVGGLVTYIITALKDRRDRKIEYEKDIGSKIAKSLYFIRETLQIFKEIEVYNLEEELEKGNSDGSLSKHAVYPSILSDGKTLISYFDIINDARKEHEIYLSYKSSSYLFYISNYLLELTKFAARLDSVDYPLLGAFLITDFQNWQEKFDKVIVKEINKNKLKLVSKSGYLWEWNKKRINKKYWDKSLLKELLQADVSTFEEVVEYCLSKVK